LLSLGIIDRTQTQDAIRRNHPVVGHSVFVFGVRIFRQYFAMDREELPFNRAQRMGETRRRQRQQHCCVRINPKPECARHADLVNAAPSHFDNQFASTDPMVIEGARSPLRRNPSSTCRYVPRRNFQTCRAGLTARLCIGWHLDEHWRRRASPYHLQGRTLSPDRTAKFGVRMMTAILTMPNCVKRLHTTKSK
jgi:hypothetical protein